MKKILFILSTILFSVTAVAQTVYSNDQIIKVSDYIYKLEQKDSALKAELNTVNPVMLASAEADAEPIAKVKAMKEAYAKLADDLAAHKVNYDTLKAKFDELEKINNDLKANATKGLVAATNDDTSDELLKDPSKQAQYFKTIRFETNNAKLDKSAIDALNKTIAQMKANKNVKFVIHGHADNSGTDAENMKLSIKRADAVKNYIVSKGIKATMISCEGFGSTKSLASNDTQEGKSKNRRAEIRVKL